jgi:hypothetical protein
VVQPQQQQQQQQQQQHQDADPSAAAAEAQAGPSITAPAEDFALLSAEQVQQLEVVECVDTFRLNQTRWGAQRVKVQVGTSGPLYIAVMKTYFPNFVDGQEQLQRLLDAGVPAWILMGREVVRVVGAQVFRDERTNEITRVRLFMVDKGTKCRDLGQVLKKPPGQAQGAPGEPPVYVPGAEQQYSNIRLRYGRDTDQLLVVKCHGNLVPVQAVLARMVQNLRIVHEEHGMVTRDFRPENILLTEGEQLVETFDSEGVPGEEVLKPLAAGEVEVRFWVQSQFGVTAGVVKAPWQQSSTMPSIAACNVQHTTNA